ncbi:MAG TPA: hypothetical protein VLB44_24460 [Kofleriaceae bacterium]|nr:hypothetical protein [Kofleriaceae bacterium]
MPNLRNFLFGGGHTSQIRGAARRLGAVVEETPRAIWLIKNGVRVAVAIHQIEEYGPQLQLRAIATPPGLPRFRVYPEGFKSFASKIFGGQDIELGMSAFDVQYMIKGDDPDLVQQVLTPDRCVAMLGSFREATLVSKGAVVTLTRESYFQELEISDEVLDAGFDFMFDVCSADVYGNALLRSLPDATYRQAPLPYVDIAGPGEIRVGFARPKKKLLVSEARATAPNLAELPERTVERARALGATVERNNDQVVLTWPSVVRDPQPLVAAIELLRSLITGPSEGVFR